MSSLVHLLLLEHDLLVVLVHEVDHTRLRAGFKEVGHLVDDLAILFLILERSTQVELLDERVHNPNQKARGSCIKNLALSDIKLNRFGGDFPRKVFEKLDQNLFSSDLKSPEVLLFEVNLLLEFSQLNRVNEVVNLQNLW